jgi:lipopolysaccharide export system protein LptA
MWTPKRIIMLSGCFLAFFIVYLSYACTALGRMDGLPPLPEAYWPNPSDPGPPPVKNGENQLARKIKLAFGAKCKELNRPIRLDVTSKGMVLCAEQFELKEGKVSLFEPSLALFGKDKKDGLPAEINTLSGQTALLTFDRPVHNFSEIGSRKIVEAEIQGNIEIRNNRRRIERDQDIHVSIQHGPLYYKESTHRVWTEDNVRVEDFKSKPQPHIITGKGMEMQLSTEAAHEHRHPERKPASESINGVEWIELKSGVVMDLYSDGKDGLLAGGTQAKPAAPPAQKPAGAAGKPTAGVKAPAKAKAPAARAEKAPSPERSHIHITTPGSFRYKIFKDHDEAYFDMPSSRQGQLPNMPPQVAVDQHNLTTDMHDHLVCHHLQLRLRRKENKPGEKGVPAENKTDGEGAEIESIHATGPQGVVTLTSDREKLDATCSDLYHNAVQGLTILKDEREVVVHKEDNDIHASELHIQDVKPTTVPGQPEPKPYQNITARGPGHIRTVSKDQPAAGSSSAPAADGPKMPHVQHAYWHDLLTFSKDNGLDLLVLNGKARFIDEQAEQSMQADVIKVWLDEAGQTKAVQTGPAHGAAAPAKSAGAAKHSGAGKADKDKGQASEPGVMAGRKPRHIEAVGSVIARSRQMNIHDTGRLVIWFTDVPNSMHMPPATGTQPTPAHPQRGSPAPDRRPTATTVPGTAPAPRSSRGGTSPEAAPRQGKPMPAGPAASPSLASRTQGGSDSLAATGPNLPPADNRPPPRPFDLTARSVEAKILRSEIKSTIDELWCEGSVAIKQEPDKAEEQGTDVRGDTVKMTARGLDLYYLVVTGDLGMLQTDKICIWGTEINIDQSTNKAWVYGEGIMKMVSASNFQGEKTDKPVPLTVLWQQSMLFNGTSAEFIGNVQGEQEKARLACQRMHVFFDRTISLKEGNKSDEPAKVREMVCDRDVRVDDSVYEGDILKTLRKLRGPGMQVISITDDDGPAGNGPPIRPAAPSHPGTSSAAAKTGADKPASEKKGSDGNLVHVSGPGDVTIIERGGESDWVGPISPGKPAGSPARPGAPAPAPPHGQSTASKPAGPPGGKPAKGKPAANKSDPDELKLTYVEFQKRMDADSKKNMVWFWGDVRVLNLPCKSFDAKVNLDATLAVALPEKAMYMRCDRLVVLDHPTDGQPNKQMEGHGRVYLQGREFYGRADSATYNQQKEQVILLGGDGYALLYRQTAAGGAPSVLEAKKIIYNRTTGETNAFEVRSASDDSHGKSGAAPRPTPKTQTPPK